MARTTLLQPIKADHATAFHSHTGAPATSLLLLLLLVAAAVAAVVVSLCTSGKNARPGKQRRSSLAPAPAPQQEEEQDGGGGGSCRNKQLLASLSGIGVKAAAVAKLVSWNRRSPPASGWSSDGDADDAAADGGDGTAEDEEEALWKKTIILGDKCRPLQFSGHIAHDSDGNPMMQPQPSSAINKGDDDAAAEG